MQGSDLDLKTWRPGDPETRRPGDLETWRPGDLETWSKQLISRGLRGNLTRLWWVPCLLACSGLLGHGTSLRLHAMDSNCWSIPPRKAKLGNALLCHSSWPLGRETQKKNWHFFTQPSKWFKWCKLQRGHIDYCPFSILFPQWDTMSLLASLAFCFRTVNHRTGSDWWTLIKYRSMELDAVLGETSSCKSMSKCIILTAKSCWN